MRRLYYTLRNIITVIALLVFAVGIAITFLGIYDFVHVFTFFAEYKSDMLIKMIAVGLLQAVDLFLIAIVMFVFALGLLVLFDNKEEIPLKLPEWLKVKNFMQLKIVLWEAILTTLVVSYLAGLVQAKMNGEVISVSHLILPGSILLISLSLYFLKKGEH